MAAAPERRGRKPKPVEEKNVRVSLSLEPALIAQLREEVANARANSISDAASQLMWRGLSVK